MTRKGMSGRELLSLILPKRVLNYLWSLPISKHQVWKDPGAKPAGPHQILKLTFQGERHRLDPHRHLSLEVMLSQDLF
jgi:hypothetical protein